MTACAHEVKRRKVIKLFDFAPLLLTCDSLQDNCCVLFSAMMNRSVEANTKDEDERESLAIPEPKSQKQLLEKEDLPESATEEVAPNDPDSEGENSSSSEEPKQVTTKKRSAASDEESKTSTPSKRSRSLSSYKKAPDAPRRFKSAYMFFSTEKHREIRQQLRLEGRSEKVRMK